MKKYNELFNINWCWLKHDWEILEDSFIMPGDFTPVIPSCVKKICLRCGKMGGNYKSVEAMFKRAKEREREWNEKKRQRKFKAEKLEKENNE